MFGREWRNGNLFNPIEQLRLLLLFLQMLHGQLVDDKLIKLAEEMSPNNPEQLQSDMSAIDTCSKIS